MIRPTDFIAALRECGIRFITGVPDSLLKDFCAAATAEFPPEAHIIAANEGAATGMAIGHFLASGRPALVYMQNSGLGNIVNPLASLADPAVYSIPMLLMIGWRSEILPDASLKKDEPQHVKQGQITIKQLEILDIPYQIVDSETDIFTCINSLLQKTISGSRPAAMLVRSSTFAACQHKNERSEEGLPSREAVIETILQKLPDDVPIVSTTGMASRELFELRKKAGTGHHRDFLTVGGMGHAVSIASGIALTLTDRKVICLDGDGAMLMHMGALTSSSECHNLVHIVLNNGSHDSVGGQPTRAEHLDLAEIAKSCGYTRTIRISDPANISISLDILLQHHGSGFLEISCRRGSRPDLGRPDKSPAHNKETFMNFLSGSKQ
jgi:phosphonopyruvate decarboxylase